ncbi:unnamed protein product [Paramecium pentaurelia]|uniref:Uncharacterized protein n=1 Tax=Paramecium pentaurelia TaxID=43138 RepID=A0A8S1SLT7_9CILI|nr:unnamed protein product [Paramecium pentaurelia]
MELSENSQSISGWLQDYDNQIVHQINKPINQLVINKQKFSKRSISLCQHQQDQEQQKSSITQIIFFDLFLQVKNSNQLPLSNQIMNNNIKIQELKRIMEFLQVNEKSKYDAYQQYQRQADNQQQETILQSKGQFKIKLNSSNKQILQPQQQIYHINALTDRQLHCQNNNLNHRRVHLKTDHHQEFVKSSSIHKIFSIKEVKPRMTKQMNEVQTKQKEFELLQLMIERHKENVQQYFPKKNRYLR